MKLLFLLPLCVCLRCLAGPITLAWDSSTGTNVGGYRLYASQNLTPTNFYGAPVNIDTGTNTMLSLQWTNYGQWYFGVTAYDNSTNAIQSDLSNILPVYFLPPPTNLAVLSLEYTTSLTNKNWQDLGFFRVKLGGP